MCLVYSDIPVKCWVDAAKYGNILVDFENNVNLQKYIGHDFCNLVIEVLFIIFGYIELLVINLMFLSKYNYCN